MSGKDKRKKEDTTDRRLIRKEEFTDLKETAEDRDVWRTVRRDCHSPV